MRTIKRKISECLKNGERNVIESNEKRLLSYIHRHHSRSSNFFKIFDQEAWTTALINLEQFLMLKMKMRLMDFYEIDMTLTFGEFGAVIIILKLHWAELPLKLKQIGWLKKYYTYFHTTDLEWILCFLTSETNWVLTILQILMSLEMGKKPSWCKQFKSQRNKCMESVSEGDNQTYKKQYCDCKASTSCATAYPMNHVHSIVISPYEDFHLLSSQIQRTLVVKKYWWWVATNSRAVQEGFASSKLHIEIFDKSFKYSIVFNLTMLF